MTKLIRMALIAVGVITLWGCAKPETLYTWVENVSFRAAPGLDTEVIAQLEKGEQVIYYGEKSDFLSDVTIRCIDFKTNWIKVKRTKDESYGWVYAAAVRVEPADPESHWRIIVFYTPSQPADEQKAMEMNWAKLIVETKANLNRNTVFIEEVRQGAEACVKVGDKKYPVYSFDLSQFMKPTLGFASNTFGYFIMENKKKPVFFVPEIFSVGEVVDHATNYFLFDITK
ncbi:MAG: hypothetical protein A2Y33_15500 [Spirochaetes bacterium GWF1_51_8]|nr:MAG: hypothetical protein A2Y33_15500 [Spirochaetes bacterium GWF1_51_8]